MALPPVPLRVPVLEGLSGAPNFVRSVLAQGFISRDWAVFVNALAHQIDLNTPIGTFANNASAVAAGIAVGQTYQTATGELRVVV